jgi:hypothetical protein
VKRIELRNAYFERETVRFCNVNDVVFLQVPPDWSAAQRTYGLCGLIGCIVYSQYSSFFTFCEGVRSGNIFIRLVYRAYGKIFELKRLAETTQNIQFFAQTWVLFY